MKLSNPRTNRLTHSIRAILAATLMFSASHGLAQAIDEKQRAAEEMAREAAYLERGHELLRSRQWEQALRAFEEATEAKHESDQALYWQAYALSKMTREREAAAMARELERRFPDSPWVDDARALTISPNAAVDANGLDPELRLYALSRLMERDPDRALGLLRSFIENTDNGRLRRDALFVLGMSDDKAAQAEIAAIARDSQSPDIQLAAIQALGPSENPEAKATIESIYESSTNVRVRIAVAEAAMLMDAEDLLARIVREDSDLEVRHTALQALGASGNAEVLRELYADIDEPRLRSQVIMSLALAQDAEALESILADESGPAVRREAIQAIALLDDTPTAVRILEELSRSSDVAADQMAILDALIVLNAGTDLAAEMATGAQDRALRSRAIQVLAITDNQAALRALLENVDNNDVRGEVLRALAMAGDNDSIQAMLRDDSAEIRRQALEALVLIDDFEEIVPALQEMYPLADAKERDAILTALMVNEDAESMITLLKGTSDPNQKRQIVQKLTLMESKAAEEYLFNLLEDNQ